METVVLIGGILSLAGVLAWIALLVWAARADGRDQERRDAEASRDPVGPPT